MIVTNIDRFNLVKRISRCTVVGLVLCIFGSALYAGGGPNVGGAKLYIQQNDLEQALRVLLKEVQEEDPKNEEAWYLLGYVYARQKKYDKMFEAFDKAVELKSEYKKKGVKVSKDSGTQFHAEHGVDAILKVVWATAFNTGVKSFNEAVNATDDSLRMKSFDEAIKNFKTAATIQPDSTLAYRNWAAALLNAQRLQEAEEPLEKALKAAPDDAEIATMLAQVYTSNGKEEQALAILEDFWSRDIRTEEIADNLSRAYLRAGKVEEAKGVYKEAIEANPGNFQFLYNYGTILLEAKDYDGAIEYLTKAYEIDPESPDLNYNIGASYLNRGVAKREILPENSSDDSYIKDFELAFPYLEKSIKLRPDDQGVWFTFGRIAGQLNKIALAGYAFSKGEPTKSVLDDKLVVGMPSETVKLILGEPDEVRPLESDVFSDVEEWTYKTRKSANGKVSIPEPINVYVADGRVDALMVVK